MNRFANTTIITLATFLTSALILSNPVSAYELEPKEVSLSLGETASFTIIAQPENLDNTAAEISLELSGSGVEVISAESNGQIGFGTCGDGLTFTNNTVCFSYANFDDISPGTELGTFAVRATGNGTVEIVASNEAPAYEPNQELASGQKAVIIAGNGINPPTATTSSSPNNASPDAQILPTPIENEELNTRAMDLVAQENQNQMNVNSALLAAGAVLIAAGGAVGVWYVKTRQ